MRHFALDVLLTICPIALMCLVVSVINAQVGMLERWPAEREARNRTHGRPVFIRSSWFSHTADGSFVAPALALMYLLD